MKRRIELGSYTMPIVERSTWSYRVRILVFSLMPYISTSHHDSEICRIEVARGRRGTAMHDINVLFFVDDLAD